MSDKETSIENESNFRVCLLGSEGAGKTCFVAGLAILSEPNHATPLSIRATDTVTVKYVDELRNSLRSSQWPPGTTVTKILKIRVTVNNQCIDMRVADYKGEDFRAALKQLEYEKIQELHEHYAKSDVLILLFDPLIDLQTTSSDTQAQQFAVNRLDAHLQAISQQWQSQTSQQAKEPLAPPIVAVVITKCDLIPNLRTSSQARDYFRQHARHLDLKIRQTASVVGYFPLSSIGLQEEAEQHLSEQGNLLPPKEISPFGYEDLFRWVVKQRRMRKWLPLIRRLSVVSAVAGAILLIIGLVWSGFRYGKDRQEQLVLQDPGLSLSQKLEETKDAQSGLTREMRFDLLRNAIERISLDIDKASTVEILTQEIEKLQELRKLNPGALESELNELAGKALSRKEDLLFDSCQDAFEQKSNQFQDIAAKFLSEFAGSSRSADVRAWLQQMKIADYTQRRSQLRITRVTNPEHLQGHVQSINEFLEKYGGQLEEVEKKRVRRAADLGKQLLERRTYTCQLKRSGIFESPRTQAIELLVDQRTLGTFWSPSASKEVAYENQSFTFQWQAGDPIEIRLWAKDWLNWTDKVATLSHRGPVAIQVFASKAPFQIVYSGWTGYVHQPFVEFTLKELSTEDFQIISDFLIPGDAW